MGPWRSARFRRHPRFESCARLELSLERSDAIRELDDPTRERAESGAEHEAAEVAEQRTTEDAAEQRENDHHGHVRTPYTFAPNSGAELEVRQTDRARAAALRPANAHSNTQGDCPRDRTAHRPPTSGTRASARAVPRNRSRPRSPCSCDQWCRTYA